MSAEHEGAQLALPLVVCLLNLGAPYLYRCLAALERQDSPVLEVYVAICRCVAGWGLPGVHPPSPRHPFFSLYAPAFHRNLILKMLILGILCYHWLGRRVGALEDQVREAWVVLGEAILVPGCGCGVAPHSSPPCQPRLTSSGLQAYWRPRGGPGERVGGGAGGRG